MKTYRMLYVALLTVPLLTACILTPTGRGPGVVMAPALPVVVELDIEPYYFHGGYHYYYHGDRWSYSNSRSGPWHNLPRDRYPKEVRRKGHGGGQDRGRGRGRGHDNR